MKKEEKYEDFENLVKEIGWATTIVLCFKKLSQKYLDSLDFGQWLEICKTALSDSEIRMLALNKMSEKATTFDQFLKIYDETPFKSEIRSRTLFRMLEKAETADQLLTVYANQSDIEIAKSVLDKLKGITMPFGKWLKVYDKFKNESEMAKLALDKISKIKMPFAEWQKAYDKCKASENKEIRDLTLVKMLETAKTVDQVLKIYDEVSLKIETAKLVLGKLGGMTAPFAKWLEVYKRYEQNEEGSKVKEIALTKISETAMSFSFP